MSGTETANTTAAAATPTGSRTVAPVVLQQHAPAVRYIDPSQSNVIMESGTKSPTVSNHRPFSARAPILCHGRCSHH